MNPSDWPMAVRSIGDRITALSGAGIEVRGVDVDRRSTPDEEWMNVTVRVPDTAFDPKHDESFHRFKQAVRRAVDDLIGDQSDFRVLYVSDEASQAENEDAA